MYCRCLINFYSLYQQGIFFLKSQNLYVIYSCRLGATHSRIDDLFICPLNIILDLCRLLAFPYSSIFPKQPAPEIYYNMAKNATTLRSLIKPLLQMTFDCKIFICASLLSKVYQIQFQLNSYVLVLVYQYPMEISNNKTKNVKISISPMMINNKKPSVIKLLV